MAHRAGSYRDHGILGGGHLASTASTHFDAGNPSAADPIDRAGSRPDFAILGYPVITFIEPWTHQGSKTALLGATPDPALARSLSNETQVTATTPPTFLFHTNADTTVPVENSVQYFLALRKAGVACGNAHLQGRRARRGPGTSGSSVSEWPKVLANWLRASGFIK